MEEEPITYEAVTNRLKNVKLEDYTKEDTRRQIYSLWYRRRIEYT